MYTEFRPKICVAKLHFNTVAYISPSPSWRPLNGPTKRRDRGKE